MPAGRVPCRSQVWPKLDVAADQSAVPSLATTVQSAAVVHFTEETAMAPAGATDGAQLFPPLCVVSTTPVPGSAPVDPTAMHTLAPGHETPVRAGGVVPALNGCVVQVRPPLTVATITVAPLTGVAIEAAVPAAVVVVVGALGPGTPTAQQCSASAQDTALSSPVPAGAGCPTATEVPDGCPRTGGALVPGVRAPSEHEAPITATVTRRAGTHSRPGRRAEWEGDVERRGTAGGQ